MIYGTVPTEIRNEKLPIWIQSFNTVLTCSVQGKEKKEKRGKIICFADKIRLFGQRSQSKL
jgi:hypothetical protein